MRRHRHHRMSFFVSSFTAIISSLSIRRLVVKLAFPSLILLAGLASLSGAGVSAAVTADDGAIPSDAIRIRILANSDSSYDQQVKRDVQGRVAAEIVSWGAMPVTHDEARALIADHLPQIRQIAADTLEEQGAPYGAAVELGDVPFPDKVFGERTYAAGDYEALRISLGGGEGANWWCVLFPPLCLTAATAPDEQAPAAQTEKQPAKTAAQSQKLSETRTADGAGAEKDQAQAPAGDEKPEARFFLWELLERIGRFLSALFS